MGSGLPFLPDPSAGLRTRFRGDFPFPQAPVTSQAEAKASESDRVCLAPDLGLHSRCHSEKSWNLSQIRWLDWLHRGFHSALPASIPVGLHCQGEGGRLTDWVLAGSRWHFPGVHGRDYNEGPRHRVWARLSHEVTPGPATVGSRCHPLPEDRGGLCYHPANAATQGGGRKDRFCALGQGRRPLPEPGPAGKGDKYPGFSPSLRSYQLPS